MSRRSAKSRRLRRRPSRTIPAVIVAVALLAVAVLAVTVTVIRLTSGSWPAALDTALATGGDTPWGAPAAVGLSAAVVLMGLIVAIAGLKLGAFKAAALQPPAGERTVDQVEYVISSRALAKLSAAHADTVDGVDSVSASAAGRTVRLRITTTSEQTAAIRQQVRDTVTSALTSAGVHPAPKVTASVHTKEI